MQIENNLEAAGPTSDGCTLQGLVYRQKPLTSPAMARPNSSESAEVMQGLCQTLQVRGPFQSNLSSYISGPGCMYIATPLVLKAAHNALWTNDKKLNAGFASKHCTNEVAD